MQHKQDLVKAIKAQQYSTAAAVLEAAIAASPEDALLLEFQAAVQAKLKLDNDASSSDDGDAGEDDGSEGSQGSSSEEDDGTDEQDQDADAESTDEDAPCSASDAGEEGLGTASTTSGTGAVAAGAGGTNSNGQPIQGCALDCQGQLPMLQDSSQQDGCGGEVCSITLAASSCTLTPQRRQQLRQQLAASVCRQKEELVRQQLLESDPLLAA